MMVGFLIELVVRGVVLCLLASVLLVLLRRTAAAYRHLVCVLALFGLLVLPLAHWLMPPLVVRTPQPPVVPGRVSDVVTMPQKPLIGTDAGTNSTTLLPQGNAAMPRPGGRVEAAPVQDRSQDRFLNVTSFLVALWGVGALALLIRLRFALFRLHQLLKRSRKAMLGGVPIWVSEQVATPLTWGIRRTVILLPAALVSGNPAVCDSALRHEQAHIARGDWVWNLFAEVVCALCWFQPGAWWLRSRMRLESERACDDRVLLSGIAGPDYASHLLEIVRSVGRTEVAPAMAHSGAMEERMRHILDTSKPRRIQHVWLAVSAPLALALLSLAALRVSALPEDTPRQTDQGKNQRQEAVKSEPSGLQPAKSAKPAVKTPMANSADVPPADAPLVSVSPAVQSENPVMKLDSVVWGEAVEGLEPGLLLNMPGVVNDVRVPFNSQVAYKVLIRNVTDQERIFEFQCSNYGPANSIPYVIPSDDLWDMLRSRTLPDRFRARGLMDEAEATPKYYAKLAPGEAIVVPEEFGLYIGDDDKASYPRMEAIKAGMNWILQPIMLRLLDASERIEFAKMSTTPYGASKLVVMVDRNGKTRRGSIPLLGGQAGGKQTYARIQLEMGTADAEATRSAARAIWGKADKGMQCGIRLLSPKRSFQVGDTLEAELLWRNTSNAPIVSVLPRRLDLYPTIHDVSGQWLAIDFGGRMGLRPGSHTYEPGEVRSLGVIAVTLVAPGTSSPKSNQERGHIALSPGTYRFSGFGGVGTPDPESGAVEFVVIGEKTAPAEADGISWGEKVRGFQLGARVVGEVPVFKVGEVIKFQAFGRNLSGQDVTLSIGNYWKVNYKIQVETFDGKPIYMERDKRNPVELVAGYRAESFGNGATLEISEARLKVAPPLPKTEVGKTEAVYADKDAFLEVVSLPPGRYRVRLLSWGVFGDRKPEPCSGWVSVEVKME